LYAYTILFLLLDLLLLCPGRGFAT